MSRLDPDSSPSTHCIAQVRAIAAQDAPDRRAVLQLGYNLGRLAEITGLGREPFWDRWKEAVARWDRPALLDLARELPTTCSSPDRSTPDQP